MQDFTNAAECYEQLTQLHPEVEDYKLYYAQSLYGACAFPEAMKATFLLDSTTSHTKVQMQSNLFIISYHSQHRNVIQIRTVMLIFIKRFALSYF